jgi:SSS family solute:Na+ symporter
MAALALIVVGKFLLPIMITQKIYTIPQFLRERYNGGVGLAFSIFWLLLYVFVNLTSVAWLGTIAIEQILGIDPMYRMYIIIFHFVIAGDIQFMVVCPQLLGPMCFRCFPCLGD